MTQFQKLISKILSGTNDKNIRFSELCNVLIKIGFQQRVKGDHHIFYKEGIEEIINIQPKKNMAKPYQVKQIRKLILDYKLGEIDE
jgi:predicted RNA binding protein YcfA (HicA-like mRNA interferase family)